MKYLPEVGHFESPLLFKRQQVITVLLATDVKSNLFNNIHSETAEFRTV